MNAFQYNIARTAYAAFKRAQRSSTSRDIFDSLELTVQRAWLAVALAVLECAVEAVEGKIV